MSGTPLPSAPPPPPPPPPPPAPYAPPPPPMMPWGPPVAAPVPPAPGWGTTHAVGEISKAMSRYRWVLGIQLVLSIVAALVTGAFLGGAAGLVSVSTLLSRLGNPSNGTGTYVPPPPPAAGLVGIEVLAAFLGLAAFILTIIAWLGWRAGLEELDRCGPEFGPAHAEAAREARRWYRWTVVSFLLTIVLAIAVVIAIVALIVGFIGSHLGANTTRAPVSSADAHAFANTFLAILVVAVVLGAVLNILIYATAATSHARGIWHLSSVEQQSQLRTGRSLMIAGALLSGGSGFFLLNPYLVLVATLGFALLFLGFDRIRVVYASWSSRPPSPSGLPAPPSPPH